MKTKIFSATEVEAAAHLLREGNLVAFPTETVYGLGADATNVEAVKQVYLAKGRPSDNPLIVHVADQAELAPFIGQMDERAQKLIHHFWPGPLTLIFTIKPDSLSPVVTGGLTTAAFRMPDHALTLELIRTTGKPLVGPSANTSGKPSPTSAAHVFHDLSGKISGILDGGVTKVGLESTVLDLSSEVPTILRPGAVTKEDLEEIIGTVSYDHHLVTGKEQPKAPGMKYKHYAPNVPVVLIAADKQNWQEAIDAAKNAGKKVGLLAQKKILDAFSNQVDACYQLSHHGEIAESMQHLFDGLRYFDDLDESVDVLYAETFSETGLGIAYMNRLKKAANQQFFE